MKAKRLRVILALLAGLLLVIVVARFWPSDEPTYQGKPVSAWFEEYAQLSSIKDANVVISQGPSGRILTLRGTDEPLPDPAWEALRALGSNAVPHLARSLGVSPLESPLYTRVLTNLPSAVRGKLPGPGRKRWYRRFAAEALAGLGEQVRAASPALLKALKQSRLDASTRSAIIHSLRRIHVYGRRNWEGDDLARLLGDILRSPDPALRREVISLLERSGTGAAPVLDTVLLALRDSDKEVRYLAARSVEAIGTNSPQVVAALRSALEDENVMVQNVTRRTLTNFLPEAAAFEADRAAQK